MADRVALLRLTGLVLVGGLLVGCTAQPDPTSPPPTPSTSTSPTSGPSRGPDDSPSAAASEAPAGRDEGGDTGAVAPGPGAALPTAAPVPLESPADFGTGVSAVVDGVRGVQAEAQGPGETSGPALRFDLTITNGSPEAVDLGSVTVNLAGADGAPGLPMLGPPASPVSGTLAAGASASGVYIFTLDKDQRAQVRLEVTYSTQAPVVAFEGSPGA